MDGYIHYESDGPVDLIAQGAHILIRICGESQFPAEGFTVQRPSFHISVIASETAEGGEQGIFLLKGDLVMVAGDGFMEEEGFHARSGIELCRIEDGNIEDAGAFAVRRTLVIFRAGACRPESFRLPDPESCFRRMVEHLLQVGLHLLMNRLKSRQYFLP